MFTYLDSRRIHKFYRLRVIWLDKSSFIWAAVEVAQLWDRVVTGNKNRLSMHCTHWSTVISKVLEHGFCFIEDNIVIAVTGGQMFVYNGQIRLFYYLSFFFFPNKLIHGGITCFTLRTASIRSDYIWINLEELTIKLFYPYKS